MKKIILIIAALMLNSMLVFTGCKPQPEQNEGNNPMVPVENLPEVVTVDVEDISYFSAVSGGEILSDGGFFITAKGVCWSTNPNPTINDSKTTDGNGAGSFTSELTQLEPGTTYYVRAYATNEAGTGYGSIYEFSTEKLNLATVVTADVKDISYFSAGCGGNVTDDGNVEITARGVCWSTNPNPTINDSKTTDGSGAGSFTSELTQLEHGTTYYVRAYATNESGTAYGSVKEFTTLAYQYDGKIDGHDYVDLGLPSGLKWATCNVGRSGEESPENDGYHEYYEYACDHEWGNRWDIPSKEQFEELMGCKWEWTRVGARNGYKVTGPNGNHIFLPAAGRYTGPYSSEVDSWGYYWSRTIGEDYYTRYCLEFNENSKSIESESSGELFSTRLVAY